MTMIQRSTRLLAVVSATLLCCAYIAFSSLAVAQNREDPASVILAASLYEFADKESQVIANLPAGEVVTVLRMSGAYSSVRAKAGEGWVLSSRLQIGDVAARESSGGGDGGSSWLRRLSGLFGGSSARSSGANVTIGIRGLQREDVANAQPKPAAVARLERYVVSVTEAQAMARSSGLNPVEVAYLDAPGAAQSNTVEQQWGSDR